MGDPTEDQFIDVITHLDMDLSAAFNSYGQFLGPKVKIVSLRPSARNKYRYSSGEHHLYGRIERNY